jgi:pimeloyl-ACP methyl ester carboxylesterase
MSMPIQPTVVLVHGAFTDASSWSRVIDRLQRAGLVVKAPANPLRSLTDDGEYVASVVSQIDGPVILVGHSYGGPVITYASSKAVNVKALVFVASFCLEQGDTTLGTVEAFPPSDLNTALQPRSYPRADKPGTELYIEPGRFHDVFAADLPAEEAAVLAVSQRPVADIALREPLAVEPGWKKLPSWFIVAGSDHAINPDSERAAAERMGATMAEIDGGSHAIALSQPDRVSQVILDAATAVRASQALLAS